MKTTQTRLIWGATLVLLLAAALRIYNITLQSIWFDEAFAWNIVIQEDMFPRISTDTHPPLYYLLLRGWMAVAGDSPLALRMLSALISTSTVALVYQVGRGLVHGRDDLRMAPLLAALLLALSDAEIFLAQETRNYALYTFFACLSMWGYLRWIQRPNRWAIVLWVGGTSALAYTHYQGLFIPAIQGMHALLFLRGRMRINAVGLLALSGVPVLPWFLFVTIPQAQNAIDNSLPFAIPSNWDTLLALRDSYLGAVWSLQVVLALMGLGVLLVQPGRRKRGFGAVFLVGMWFALPFAVLFFGNFFAALLTERKLLIVAPAIVLMAGVGLARLDPLARGLVALALVIYGVSSVDYWRVKEPWDDIAQPALTLGQPSDLYMPQVEVGQYPMKYYWQRHMPEGAVFSTFPFLGDPTMAPTTDTPTYYDGLLPQNLFPYNQQNRVGDVATAWVLFWSRDDTLLHTLEDAGYIRTWTRTTDHIGNAIDLYRYDHLPQTERATFQNGMILQAAEIDADALRFDLWWSVESVLDAEYTTSAVFLDAAGQVVAQLDSPLGTAPMQPGTVVYEGKVLQLVDGLTALPPGTYTAVVKVYRFGDAGIVDIPTVDDAPWVEIGVVVR